MVTTVTIVSTSTTTCLCKPFSLLVIKKKSPSLKISITSIFICWPELRPKDLLFSLLLRDAVNKTNTEDVR